MAVFSNLLKGQEPDLVIHFFFPGKAKLIMWIFFLIYETLKVCGMTKNVTSLTSV